MPEKNDKQKPVARVQYGGIKAPIWENQTSDNRLFHSFSLTRSYRDESGEWHDTTSFRLNDVKDIEACVEDVYRWLRTTGRQRAQQHQQPDGAEAPRASALVETDEGTPF